MMARRYLACLLAVLMVFSLIPVGQALAYSGWSSQYESFILNQEYLYSGRSFNSDAYSQPRFSLYDLDQNGEPELFAFNGGPSLAASTDYVFSCVSGDIKYAGNVGYRGCELYYYEGSAYPGLFCSDGNNGVIRTTYYEMRDGSISSLDLGESVVNPGGTKRILPFYSIDKIRSMGWNTFVEALFGIPVNSGVDSDNRGNNTYVDDAEIIDYAYDSSDAIPPGEQFSANIFLSNFSEQHAFERYAFSADSPYVDDLVSFAYLYCKINRRNMLDTAQVGGSYYYTLSLENANTVWNRHFDITLSEVDAARFPENQDMSSQFHSFYENGTFYFPAADGESYNRLTVVSHIDPPENGDYRYQMYFDIYKLDIQEYMKANGSVDSSYYYLSASQAANDSRLTWENSGVALVKPYNNNGVDTYQLDSYFVVSEESAADGFTPGASPNGTNEDIPAIDLALQDSSTEYNKDLALIAAELSLATYEGPFNSEVMVVKKLVELGFPTESMYSNNFGGGSLANIAAVKPYNGSDADGNTDILVVVARGSVTWHELFMDANTGSGEKLNGYESYDIVRDFYNDIFKSINAVRDPDKNYKVLITGHSLGGAAANLVAARLSTNYYGSENVFCYTFGAIDSIVSDGTVYYGFENIHNITNFYDSFGPNGRTGFTAKGNTRYGKFGHIDLFFTDLGGGNAVSEPNHGMKEVYLPAVKEGIVEHDIPEYQKIVSLHCPVDFNVYCGTSLVGSVISNMVVADLTTIPISVVDDEKYVFLPDNSNYRFEITATDFGTMSFEVSSVSTDSILKSFSDVQLETGKSFICEVGGTIVDSEITLTALNSNGVPTETVQTRTEVSEQEIGASTLPEATKLWLTVAVSSLVVGIICLVILLTTRRKKPTKKRTTKAPFNHSLEKTTLPAFSETHCCVCGRKLGEKHWVFFRDQDGREARLDNLCARQIYVLRKSEDEQEIRAALRHIQEQYDFVDPIVARQLQKYKSEAEDYLRRS